MEDKKIKGFVLKRSRFCIQGDGVLCFIDEKDQLRRLTGEIIMRRDSEFQPAYAEVLTDEESFVMPIQNVDSITWVKKTKK